MPKPTNVSLNFFIQREHGAPCQLSDVEMFDHLLNHDDDDGLSLDGDFIVNDVQWDTPDLFPLSAGDRVLISFTIEVEPTDPSVKPAELLDLVRESAVLMLPEGYEVDLLDAVVFHS
jgi:hypothetical protein